MATVIEEQLGHQVRVESIVRRATRKMDGHRGADRYFSHTNSHTDFTVEYKLLLSSLWYRERKNSVITVIASLVVPSPSASL